MQKTFVVVITLFLAIIAIYWIAKPSDSPSTPRELSTANAEPSAPAHTPNLTTPTQAHSQVQLKGFAISLSKKGLPIASAAMRELFDALALEMGSTSADEWKHHALAQFEHQLSSEGLDQLQHILNHYVEYQLALQLFMMEGEPSLVSALNDIQQLRQDYLEPANATALFSDWQAFEGFGAEALNAINQTDNPQAAIEQLQQSLEQLPESMQPKGQALLSQMQQFAQAASQQENASEVVYRATEQIVAAELVQPNFIFTDPADSFMESYLSYQQAKAQLHQQEPSAVQALRTQYFSGADILRAKTLDRIEQL